MVCWGENDKGQVGAEDPRLQPNPVPVALPGRAVQIDAFERVSCARIEGGDVYCWGELNEQPHSAPQRMTLAPATAIAITADEVCALGEDKLRRCVGIERLR